MQYGHPLLHSCFYFTNMLPCNANHLFHANARSANLIPGLFFLLPLIAETGWQYETRIYHVDFHCAYFTLSFFLTTSFITFALCLLPLFLHSKTQKLRFPTNQTKS